MLFHPRYRANVVVAKTGSHRGHVISCRATASHTLNPTKTTLASTSTQKIFAVEVRKTGGPLPQLHEGGDWSVPWNEWGKGGALNA